MRRHMSMHELADDVLRQASATAQTKTAQAAMNVDSLGVMAQQLIKLANEIRQSQSESLTYDDIALVAEGRRAKR